MDTIQTALTTALRVKPVIELVWAELNEHPKSTGKQIAGRLKLEATRVAGALHEMALRGMVQSRVDAPRMVSNGTKRNVKEWWCVHSTYERLPLVKKPAKVTIVKEYHAKHPLVPTVAPTTVMPAPVPLVEPRVKPEISDADATRILDNMSVIAALKMYKHLHAIFNHDRKA